MRRYIDWTSLHTEYGSGSWAVIDNTLTVRTADGVMSAPLGGSTPASLARVLMHELANQRPEDGLTQRNF
jgi:hypothetical protein